MHLGILAQEPSERLSLEKLAQGCHFRARRVALKKKQAYLSSWWEREEASAMMMEWESESRHRDNAQGGDGNTLPCEYYSTPKLHYTFEEVQALEAGAACGGLAGEEEGTSGPKKGRHALWKLHRWLARVLGQQDRLFGHLLFDERAKISDHKGTALKKRKARHQRERKVLVKPAYSLGLEVLQFDPRWNG